MRRRRCRSSAAKEPFVQRFLQGTTMVQVRQEVSRLVLCGLCGVLAHVGANAGPTKESNALSAVDHAALKAQIFKSVGARGFVLSTDKAGRVIRTTDASDCRIRKVTSTCRRTQPMSWWYSNAIPWSSSRTGAARPKAGRRPNRNLGRASCRSAGERTTVVRHRRRRRLTTQAQPIGGPADGVGLRVFAPRWA